MSGAFATTHKTGIRDAQSIFCRCLLGFAILFSALFIGRAERLPVKIYTTADGLGSSFINSTMRDSRGFLWFATRDGLSRFDGREFTTYQIGEKDAPPGIEQILETRNGVYWITTTGGLYRFDPKASESAPTNGDGRNVLSVQRIGDQRGALYEDSRGNLWLGANSLYLIEETGGKFALRKTELNPPEEKWQGFGISGFQETRDGSLWITTTRGMIRRLPDGRDVFYGIETTTQDNLNASLAEDDGRIWFASGSDLYVFKAESPEALPANENIFVRRIDAREPIFLTENLSLPENRSAMLRLPANSTGNRFRRVFRSSDGHVWITAVQSLIEFDGRRWQIYDKSHGLTAEIIDITEDAGGNLWLSGGSGLMRLNHSGMTAYGAEDGLGSLSVQSLFFKNDAFYAVTGSGFISRFDGRKFETVRPPTEPNPIFLWTSHAGFPDSRGEWWILTGGKLYRFAAPKNFRDLAAQKPLAVYDGASEQLKSNLFYRMFEDSSGNLWISTHARDEQDDMLARWNPQEEKFQVFSESEGFPKEKSLSAFVEDGTGTAWLGFYQGGLAFYRDGRFTEIRTENLPQGFITALSFDRKNRLWLASSQSGVSRIDNPSAEQLSFVRFTTENGLSSNNVRTLVEAENGDIYVGTARGVDRISPETGSVRHFSINDGLTGDFVTAAARDREGALWFGTSNGLSRLKPEPEKQGSPPPVWFSALRIAGESRFVPALGAAQIGNLELSASQNNLQIEFFAVDFSASGALRYQHKLEGADADWSAPTEERAVNYANLAPGAYRFLVRAVNPEGAVGEASASVSFNILAPFWRRWWFITAIVLFVAAGVFALDRYRVKKTEEVEKALDASRKSERIARESETRYRTLAQTASDAIITIDENSRIVYVNEAVEAIFGYTAAELAGENLTKLMPEAVRPRHENGVERYLQTRRKNIGRATLELTGRHKTGREIPLELSFGEFEQDGQKFFTGIARDVTERKRAEAALQKAREERLAELERVRSRIARDLHDDVGSSLTQIALFSEVARQSGNGAGHESLDFIASTANELVESMADIVWAINPQKDHLHDLTQRMRRFASEIFTAADIDLEFRAPEANLDAPLGANLRREVFLIFKESVNNVVKHADAKAVEIEFTIENDCLILTLKDDGRGFEPDAEAVEYDWQATKGGNGLPGMKKRATELGGEFSVESKLGKGTLVTLRVPLEKIEE
ncbi:MAG TPA: two-component regulator propeller domain-containing protein [Pyrinomonadaceae bacterium]